MDTRCVHKFVNSFTVSLAVVAALYVSLILGTTLALNHEQSLSLNDVKIGRIWLPDNYAPDDGYEVPLSVILRDLRSEMLFGRIGTRSLDVLAIMGVLCVGLQLGLRVSERRPRLRLAERPSVPRPSRAQASRRDVTRLKSMRPVNARSGPALQSERAAPDSAMHPPLGKAAPYGDTHRASPRGKLLSFPKR